MRASRPRSLKARMAFLTVCEAHPRLRAIFGGDSAGARQKYLAPAHHEGIFGAQPGFEPSRSFFDSSRTKIGGFMGATIAHHTQPSLRMH